MITLGQNMSLIMNAINAAIIVRDSPKQTMITLGRNIYLIMSVLKDAIIVRD